MVLPGRSDRRDHLLVCLRWRCCWGRCCCWCGSRWSLVVDGGCGGSSRRGGGSSSSSRSSGFNGRSVRSHARSGRSVRTSGRDRLSNGSLAGDRGTVRGESHLVVLLVVLVAGGRHRRSRGRVAAGAVEAGSRAQWRRGRQADRNTGHDRFIGTRLRTRVRRADSLAFCGYFISYLFIPSDACDKRWTYWLAERRHCQRPERGSRWKAESIWAGPQPEAREAAGESESRTQAPQ